LRGYFETGTEETRENWKSGNLKKGREGKKSSTKVTGKKRKKSEKKKADAVTRTAVTE